MSFQGYDELFPAKQSGEPRTPVVGELVAGKYRVESQLGVGGMGAVLAARHEQLGQVVALKVLHPIACEDPDSVARFMREAQSSAALESEHVVRIFDVGTARDGTPFMVMERLVGSDLSQLLERHGPLDVNLAALCVYQAALGVADAHAAGIIHRDLKPSNLFLVRKRDGSPLVKVLDFGISKALDAANSNVHLTQTRTIVGSPLYMSPEQVRDARRVDARSDVWSLGVILHELLSGRPAFDGDTLPGVCARIVADPPATITRADVPPELLALVERCLQKDPSARYQTVQDLIDALRPLLGDATSALAALGVPSAPAASRASRGGPQSTSSDHVGTIVEGAGRFGGGASVPGDTRASVSDVSESGARTTNAAGGTTAHSAQAFTQGSAAFTQSSAQPARPSRAGSSRRRWLTIAVGAAAVAAVGSLVLVSTMQSPAEDPAPLEKSVTQPAEVLLSLRVVSEPSGAEVLDGPTVLGKTPLTLPLRSSDRTARQLELRLAGYKPYSLEVRPEGRDADVRVELKPEVQAPNVAVSSEVAPKKTAPPKGKPTIHSASTKKVAPPPTPVPSSKPASEPDIRMKR